MFKNKKYLSIVLALLLTISVAVCFTACKKDKGKTDDITTSALTPEEASILESQLEKDDNVVEDPFGAEDEEDVATTAASGKSGSNGSGSNSGSNSGSSSSGSTTKKSSNNTTTTQRTSKASQETTLPEAEDVTDENGDHWTGWY